MFMQRKLQKIFSFLDYIKRTIHFIGKTFLKGLKGDCGSGRPLYLCIVIKNKWH